MTLYFLYKELWLSFDNDPARIKMSIQPSIGKDWNEELVQNHMEIEPKYSMRKSFDMSL